MPASLLFALVSCGGTGDVSIGDSGIGADQSLVDALAFDRTAPEGDSRSGTDARADGTQPSDAATDSNAATDGAKKPTDAHLDTSAEATTDGSGATEDFDGATEDSDGATEDMDGATEDATDATTCVTTCVPEIPSGWTGPVELYVGGSSSSPPPCGTGFQSTPTYDGHADLTAAPATCSSCACGAATGASCVAVVAEFYSDAECTSACGASDLTGGTCTDVTTAFADCGATPTAGPYVTISTSASGFCPASTVTATKPAASWATLGQACAPTTSATGMCTSGGLCVPATSSSYDPGYCISRAGDVACPAAGYTVKKTVLYGNYSDTRTCSSCTCDLPDSCSSGEVDAYSDVCVSMETDFYTPLPQSCAPIDGTTTDIQYRAGSSTMPTCAVGAGSGIPTGTATPTEARTFCCTI